MSQVGGGESAAGSVLLSAEGALARITLNRPDVLNAMNPEMVGALREAVATVAARPDWRALLITGAGRGFCAGADLAAPKDEPRPGEDMGDVVGRRMDEMWNPMVRDLAALSIPVVVAVNGVAAGGGVGLALSGDIVLAAESAAFVLVFGPKLGLVPDLGASWFLPHSVGRAMASGLCLTGERLSARDAERAGLVWRTLPDDALMAEAEAIARKLAAGPSRGLSLIKQALKASPIHDLDAQLALECRLQREAGQTEDFAEGVAAFLAKRQPAFTGR